MSRGLTQQNDKSRRALPLIGAALRETMGVVIVAVTLFVPPGRLDWVMGWALVGLYALWVATTALVLLLNNPELYLQRASRMRPVEALRYE